MLDAKHIVANDRWQAMLPLKFGHIFRSGVLGLLAWFVMKKHCFKFLVILKFSEKLPISSGIFTREKNEDIYFEIDAGILKFKVY